MNKVIEVDFLPRETDVAFSWLNSMGDFALRRVLIVDNDKSTTHLVKILLDKDRALSGLRRKRFDQGPPDCPEFSAGSDLP